MNRATRSSAQAISEAQPPMARNGVTGVSRVVSGTAIDRHLSWQHARRALLERRTPARRLQWGVQKLTRMECEASAGRMPLWTHDPERVRGESRLPEAQR